MNKMKFIKSQDDWDDLLELISDTEGFLTPIIGKEIFKYRDENGLSPLEPYLSKKLFEKFKIGDPAPQSISDTAQKLIYENNAEPDEIITGLDDTIKDIKFDFPLLTDLLKITDLKFFINTTVFYDIIEKNLKEIRNEEPDIKNFSPYGLFQCDQDLTKLSKSFIFNAFGSLKKDPAISEEDMLEFTSQFSEKMKLAPTILYAFQNNNLLFLGCAYPDWLTRFVLRLLTTQAMNEWGTGKPRRKIYVVNDKSPFRDELFQLLKYYHVISFEGDTGEFISELLSQWKKKYQKPKQIFLSYTRSDKDAVENLQRGLEQVKNIRCWYDKEDLDPAVRWRDEIITQIGKSDLFIPLISNNSLEHKGYVEKEWDMAFISYVQIKEKKGDFIVPIVIDNTDPYDSRVPKDFTERNIEPCPGGNPTEKLLNAIKKMLDLA